MVSNHQDDSPEVTRQAAEWIVRLEMTESDAEINSQFSAWLNADPVRLSTFKRMHESWARADVLKTADPEAVWKYLFPGESAPKVNGSSSVSAQASRKVVLPPGHTLGTIASVLLTRESYKRYVMPVIADMQEEYIEAIAADHNWHAWWIVVRGHVLIIPGWLYAYLARAIRRIFFAS